MRAELVITARAPLAFRAGRDAAHADSLPYLPGTAVRGALAAAHRLLRPGATEEFESLFLRERIHFANAYPSEFGQRELQDDQCAVYPLPVTARSCKRFAGFKFQSDASRDLHGVSDHLLPWVLFALSNETRIEPLDQVAKCARCGEVVEVLTGYFRRGLGSGEIGKANEDSALVTRTGISRETGAVQRGVLYSRVILPKGSRFWTEFLLPDELYDGFRDFAMEAAGTGLLRVGTNRTRGLGRISLTEVKPGQDESEQALEGRIRAFDEALRKAARDAGIEPSHALYIPLTLTSDAILPDGLLRHCTRLDGDYLANRCGVNGAELVYHAAGTRRVVGWNDLWGLPKPDEIAIAMGSAFVFGFKQDPSREAVARLQAEGVGTRRSEGFGKVRVADPFHWEVHNA